jgi:hypothetical protein
MGAVLVILIVVGAALALVAAVAAIRAYLRLRGADGAPPSHLP